MGLIINPRGMAGAGKTELVRRILMQYGWRQDPHAPTGDASEPIFGLKQDRLFGFRLPHPFGERPLAVIGRYDKTSGGCDRIRLADGGILAIVNRASDLATAGYDVIIEGLRLSSNVEHSLELGRQHDLHILHLQTPVDQCVRNLISRRRTGRHSSSELARAAALEQRSIETACDQLRPIATVEALTFDDAYARTLELLSLCTRRKAS
jgi:hypothetical protein